MDAWIYCADIYCYDCGVKIIRRLIREGRAPAIRCNFCFDHSPKRYGRDRTLRAFDKRDNAEWLECPDCGRNEAALVDEDSDAFPQFASDGGGEADTVWHCGSHARCVNAIEMRDGSKVGAMLENPLTSEGVADLVRSVNAASKDELMQLWRETYSWVDFGPDVGE